MKTITPKFDEELVEAAEERARLEHTTIEILLRNWIAEYARQEDRVSRFDDAIDMVRGRVSVGRKLTRDEMYER